MSRRTIYILAGLVSAFALVTGGATFFAGSQRGADLKAAVPTTSVAATEAEPPIAADLPAEAVVTPSAPVDTEWNAERHEGREARGERRHEEHEEEDDDDDAS